MGYPYKYKWILRAHAAPGNTITKEYPAAQSRYGFQNSPLGDTADFIAPFARFSSYNCLGSLHFRAGWDLEKYVKRERSYGRMLVCDKGCSAKISCCARTALKFFTNGDLGTTSRQSHEKSC
jgi:hypothetical protein